jgi:hypothetical protein
MRTVRTRITIETVLWVPDQIDPIHPMTECAVHVAHVAKFKGATLR